MTKHTPGTWLVDDLTVYVLNNTGTDRFSAWVQRGWLNDEEGRTPKAELEANARLIAAAPDLLAACQQIMQETLRDCIDEVEWSEGERMAHAAIAKALLEETRASS